MSPRNIPGFYYDEAKGKYFKIQPSHIAPNGSPYSNDVVRKEARGQIVRKCQKLFEEKTLKQRTQRSKILGNALLGCSGLEREGGSSLDRRSVIDKAWALGLEKTAILETWGPGALFARDEATGAGVVGDTADRDVANPRGCTRFFVPGAADGAGRSYIELSPVLHESQISSLAISPSRVLMTTTMGGSQPACVQLNRLRPPDLIDTLSLSRFPFIHFPPGTFTSDISILIRHTILHSTFWASSPRPLTSRSDFALGTSQGTILVAEDQASWSFERRMGFLDGGHDQRAKEVMAVDWLDGNVVLNGCRDGSVRFWDVRSRSVAGTSVPIVHGSAVNHVRRLGGNNVVVAGIEDRMANYDLRFLRKEGGGRKGETRPCVVFRGYRNRELGALKVGFDVLGDRLVAAGMDDEGVVVFEAGTGGVVRGFGGGGGLAGCVRFVEGEGREGRRLWVGGGRGIVEWGW